jgi:hypothetical protein
VTMRRRSTCTRVTQFITSQGVYWTLFELGDLIDGF